MPHDAESPRSLEVLTRRLEWLEEVRAIEQLKFRYAQYCDDGYDAKGIAGLFRPDGRWIVDGEGGSNDGREQIEAHFAKLSEHIPWALHYVINPQVELAEDGRTATGHFRLLCLCTIVRGDGSGEKDAVILNVDYRDLFVKHDGQWYFQELRGSTHQVSNWDQGWVKQPFRS